MDGLDAVAAWANANEGILQVLGMLGGVAVFGFSAFRRRNRPRSPSEPTPAPAPAPPNTKAGFEPPSVVVLPFRHLGEDTSSSRARFLADIVHREVNARLARATGVSVIAHGTALQFAGPARDHRAIGEELGVRYAVDGTVRIRGDQVVVDVDLVSTAQGECEWTQAYDRPIDDIDRTIDDLATAAAAHLGTQLRQVEVRRVSLLPDTELAAWDHFQQASAALDSLGFNAEGFRKVEEHLRRAIDRDPDFALAKSRLALNIALSITQGMIEDAPETREEALTLAERAIEIDSRSSDVLGFSGCTFCDLGFFDRGMPLLERAVETNPSNAQAHAALGAALILQRRPDEGIPELKRSIELSPKDPGLGFWIYALGCGYMASRQIDQADTEFVRALKYDPKFIPAELQLVVLRSLQGRVDEAKRHLARAKELDVNLTPSKAAAITGAPVEMFAS